MLGISPHTVAGHIGNIRNDLNCSSQGQIVKIIESSNSYMQIRERYIDLLLFSRFQEMLGKINALEISPKYRCIAHINVKEVGKYILLDYLRLAGIKA